MEGQKGKEENDDARKKAVLAGVFGTSAFDAGAKGVEGGGTMMCIQTVNYPFERLPSRYE